MLVVLSEREKVTKRDERVKREESLRERAKGVKGDRGFGEQGNTCGPGS